MKIAIISDIHDNLVNLNKFINWANNNDVNVIFCTGDLTNEESARKLAKDFNKNIYIISGNAELYDPQVFHDYNNTHHLGETGIISLADTKFGLCHEPHFIHELIEKRPDLDIIFYGHTHKPWIEKRGQTRVVNPGTLAGLFQKATFALYDTETKKIELKILEIIK
ncbi:MAG: metallophosphoesterase family protein [Parcubacteria group bacterium]